MLFATASCPHPMRRCWKAFLRFPQVRKLTGNSFHYCSILHVTKKQQRNRTTATRCGVIACLMDPILLKGDLYERKSGVIARPKESVKHVQGSEVVLEFFCKRCEKGKRVLQ